MLQLSFSGVDGAGKSTILDRVHESLRSAGYNVVLLRSRPSCLPILSAFVHGKKNAELRAASSLPRRGGNKSKASSLLRFFYYFSDYLVGQWIIKLKYRDQSVIVLYDRYYYDYIADPRRSNLREDFSLAQPLLPFIIEPEINFFLYASPDVILQRKKELNASDIIRLTTSYQLLFSELEKNNRENKYIQIENLNIDETTQIVLEEIKKKLDLIS